MSDIRQLFPQDQHVCPRDQTHDLKPTCWCGPTLDYTDPVTSARVWIHRRTNDGPHYVHADGCPTVTAAIGEPALCECGIDV